jgi:pimeloyl-ACP methyl ester carboxylesterase
VFQSDGAKLLKQNESTNATSLLNSLRDGFKFVDITSTDGIILKSIIFDPTPSVEGEKNPTIIFISSWGMNKWEYVVPANAYADKGYTVISYTARGFWESGGEINLAGALDMADVSAVIDWSLQNSNADPSRIGLSGISYGGGISILATAFEPRIKSVAAMSCWVDMEQSMLGNGQTIRKEAVRMLQILAELTGNTSPELEELFADYFANTDLEYMIEYTYNSSAVTFMDDIQKTGAAIFIANALGDSLFVPNQFPPFFNQIMAPKHLEFAPGDHAGPELPGIFGLPDQVYSKFILPYLLIICSEPVIITRFGRGLGSGMTTMCAMPIPTRTLICRW